MRATIAVTTLACVLFLSACGIKGPLYLPPVPSENENSPASNGQHGHGTALPAPDQDTETSVQP
ncbi:MAG: lipoprotein [Azoarcus sp.]|jgi:predicted small lipoprotein YifL|nr:lipoprotein [Azoarcus sp.]